MSDDYIEIRHNGMARCGLCKEPTVPVLIGTPAEVEANSNIVVRCTSCAAVEEAEAITQAAAPGRLEK